VANGRKSFGPRLEIDLVNLAKGFTADLARIKDSTAAIIKNVTPTTSEALLVLAKVFVSPLRVCATLTSRATGWPLIEKRRFTVTTLTFCSRKLPDKYAMLLDSKPSAFGKNL
jgi:hypothetical protein